MNKIETMLGFAAKAKQLQLGSAAVEFGLKRGKIKLVICATDLSPKTIKEFKYLCETNGVNFFNYGTRLELGHWVGAPDRGVIGVVSQQFAVKLRQLLEDRGEQS